jgi:hypothetical protein
MVGMSKSPTPAELRPKTIFVSYSHADSEPAAQIKLGLEQAGWTRHSADNGSFAPQRERCSIGHAWNRNQMNVIGDQGDSQSAHPVECTILPQQTCLLRPPRVGKLPKPDFSGIVRRAG